MDAKRQKKFRRPCIAAIFGDSSRKYWNDEALEELAKDSADMMMSSSWENYYKALKKKRNFGKPDYDSDGVWYDDTGVGVALRVNFDGSMSVDG